MDNKNNGNNLSSYIFIGRSGCGKGTQVEKLAQQLVDRGVINNEASWLRLETGARFRELAETDYYTAKKLKTAIERGERLPDNFAIWNWTGLLFEKFTGIEHVFCDGCPRSLLEAQTLDMLLRFYGFSKPIVVYLEVSREESRRRLVERGRNDDKPEDIERRLDWFERDVLPAVEYYRNNPKYRFIEINGEQSRDKIHEDLMAVLDS